MYYLANTLKMKENESLKKVKSSLWWIKNEKDFEKFLPVLFTQKEIEDFALRIDIFKKLKAWESQRKIAKDLWISITTVTRGNKFYKNNKDLIDKYIK